MTRSSVPWEGTLARYRREHPWYWRRARALMAWHGFIGRHLPLLCRHHTAGDAGGDVGRCLDCGKTYRWNDDEDSS